MAKIPLSDGTILNLPDGMTADEEKAAIDQFLDERDGPVQSQQPITGGALLNQRPQQDGSISGGVPLGGHMPIGNPIQAGGNVQAGQVNQMNLPGTPNPNAREPNLIDRIASSYVGGVSGALGLPVDFLNWVDRQPSIIDAMLRAEGAEGRKPLNFRGGSQDIRQGVFGAVPDAPFKSSGGKILGGAISGASSGLGFGGIPLALAGAVGGASQQGAAEAGANEYVQFGAGLLGGFAPSGLKGIANSLGGPPASRYLSQALNGVDPETFARAQSIFDDAAAAGSKVTTVEALAEAQGGNRALQNLQRVVEQNPGGAGIMDKFLGSRQQNNKNMADNFFNQLGPQLDDPTKIAPNMQQAAQKAMDASKNRARELSKPFYEQAYQENVTVPVFNDLLDSNHIIRDVFDKIGENPAYRQISGGASPSTVKTIDTMKKYMDAEISKMENPIPGTSIDRNSLDAYKQAREELLNMTDNISPVYQEARNVYGQAVREDHDPLLHTPIDELSTTGRLAAQKNILMDPKAETLTPSNVRDTIRRLNAQNPKVATQFTRQTLSTMFDDINRAVKGDTNKYGGANFALALTGNTRQAQNIRELIRSLPGGNGNIDGFNKMVDVFNAQRWRLPPGSMTQFNEQINKQLVESGLMSSALNFSTVNYGGVLKNWWHNISLGRNSEKLAQFITSPDGIKMMQQLKGIDPRSPKATALILGSLIINGQLNDQK